MGLSVAGQWEAAEKAYGFLRDTQRADGSWPNGSALGWHRPGVSRPRLMGAAGKPVELFGQTIQADGASITLAFGLIAVLALTGSFVWLAVISTLARMIVYSISIASLPKKKFPSV